jgi:hypothetical protein
MLQQKWKQQEYNTTQYNTIQEIRSLDDPEKDGKTKLEEPQYDLDQMFQAEEEE